jgi:MFS family permease
MATRVEHHYASWLPMIVIALVQIQMAFNVSALVISMGAIVEEFDTSPTTVGTALVVYSLSVAAFVMLGAKIGSVIGARLIFQISVVIHGLSMAMMAFSTSATMMIQAQILAGLAAAAAVPSLVVLIAVHYRARQQEQALGLLGASQAMAGVAAFLIVGFLGTVIGWRWPFAMLAILALLNLALSFRLQSVERNTGVRIDWVGAGLAAAAIILVSLGVDNLNGWGLLLARSDAPFDILGLSPAPALIVAGVVFGQAFFSWLKRQRTRDKPQLFALEILDTVEERSATFCLLIIAALGPAVNFLLPLYIQIVQGRTSLETAIAIIPYTLAILVSAILVVRLYDRLPPRQIARFGFVTVAIGMFLFATAINNQWSDPAVIGSLVVIGLGEGALLTLMFNVLVSASPRELAGHVGALRGTVNNLATGLGTAAASLMAVGILGVLIAASIEDNPRLPPDIIYQINLDNVDFLTNDELKELLRELTTQPDELAEAERINEDSRLRALQISFQLLTLVALLAVVPAGRLPDVKPGEVPPDTLDEHPSPATHKDPGNVEETNQSQRRTNRGRNRKGARK